MKSIKKFVKKHIRLGIGVIILLFILILLVSVITTPKVCVFSVGTPVSYAGNNQWQYSFSFQEKGMEHITLRTWFNREGAPFGIDYTIYRCAADGCSANGGDDYLDTVDTSANYRIFLNTDKGWTSSYSCT